MTNFDDIQSDYKEFVNYMYSAYLLLSYLVRDINKFLLEYSKSKHFDEKFAYDIVANLLYLENFFNLTNEILEEIEKTTLANLKFPEINNVVNFYDYMKVPDDYEQDAYFDLNNPVDWNK